jgi:hypothetical protein
MQPTFSIALRTKAPLKLGCGRIGGQSFGEPEALDWNMWSWEIPDWAREQTLKLLKRPVLGIEEWLLPEHILLDIFDNLSYV